MLMQKQLIKHDPENGKTGDCFRASIANLLRLQIADVPHFVEDSEGGMDWLVKLNEWLKFYGFCYLPIALTAEDIRDWGISGLYSEAAIPSPRFAEAMHSISALDGYPIFDPHPDANAAAIELHDMKSIGVFAALRPWEKKQ